MRQSTIVTIPRRITGREDLVVLPRKEYEALLHTKKQGRTAALDKDLEQAIKQVIQGKISKPFSSIKALKKALE